MRQVQRLLVLGIACLLVLAACGGDAETVSTDPPTAATEGVAPQTNPPATDAVESPPQQESVAVGASTDFGGFRYHVVEASLGESFGTPVLLVSIDVENLGTEADRPTAKVSLQAAGAEVENAGFGVTADVAPGLSENGTFEFQVGAGFSFDGAVVLIGGEGSSRAAVPLAGGAVVSLAPVETMVDQVGTADLVEIHLGQVVVDWHSLGLFGESSDAGTAYLTVVVDITVGEKSRTALDTFELVLPSGRTVEPEKAPNEVLEAGVAAEGLEVAFIVPDPYAGDYVLRLLNLSRLPEGTVADVPFVLVGS